MVIIMTMFVIMMVGMMLIVSIMIVATIHWWHISFDNVLLLGSFDNFIQFTAIEPDSTAFRTIINFYTLPFGYLEHHITNGTIHFISPLSVYYVEFCIIWDKLEKLLKIVSPENP